MAKGMTKASRRLAEIKQEKGYSNTGLAELLETEPQTISRLVRGIRGPGLQLAQRIASRLYIPIEWWSEANDTGDEPREAASS